MKKVLFAMLLSMFAFTVNAQETKSVFKPYVGPGIGVSGGLQTYSAEVGCYNDQVWYAVVAEFTPQASVAHPGQMATYIGPKFYHKVKHFGNITDMFLYGATKLGVSEKNLPIAFEPGACLVFNVTKNIGLQWSFSSPIYENTKLFAPVNLNTSFAANWFF